jgi:hypothetical protein
MPCGPSRGEVKSAPTDLDRLLVIEYMQYLSGYEGHV